ncbi:MAG TPA: hypothetical protein VEV21_12855 [Burkholderiales bacterium]|nr:hypothetical protein [Burkholderiales bacterium]
MPRAGLLALAFGNFIIGTGTVIVPGMLPHLAGALDVSLPMAGQLITAFAATVCVAGLAPAQAPVSIALNSSATYLGQAIGSAAAGTIIAHISGAAGYASLARLSVPLLAAAIGLSLLASFRQARGLQP